MKFRSIVDRIFKSSSHKKKEQSMKQFSVEYRDSLVNEHKLVSASITRIIGTDWARYARQHGADVTTAAASNLKARKVELEAQIDVLNEFLTS